MRLVGPATPGFGSGQPALRRSVERTSSFRNGDHLIALAIAMKRQVASGGKRHARALLHATAKRPHGKVIRYQDTIEAESATDYLGDGCGRKRHRLVRIAG